MRFLDGLQKHLPPKLPPTPEGATLQDKYNFYTATWNWCEVLNAPHPCPQTFFWQRLGSRKPLKLWALDATGSSWIVPDYVFA